MTTGMRSILGRVERFDRVGSTNDVVRDWLASGEPEVCVAVADAQTAGRGREGRSWTAPPTAALLVSVGFRPSWLPPDRTWRLGAIAALAMADAAEAVAGLAPGTVRLKWPNDLVVEDPGADPPIRKLAGLLGETEGLGSDDPRAVVGIGVNVDWPAADFPPELAGTMTSLREVRGDAVDRDALLEAFLAGLEGHAAALRDGGFHPAAWLDRQVTTGRIVRLQARDATGAPVAETVRAVDVDPGSGALVVEDLDGPGAGRRRHVLAGEVTRLRFPSTGTV